MSLINQALKEEQRRRSAPTSVGHAPAASMARRQNNRGSGLLIGLTVAGAAMAGVVTCVLYFGSQFLGGTGAPQTAQSEPAASVALASPAKAEESAIEPELLDELSDRELAAVKKMLIERKQAKATSEPEPPETAASESPSAQPASAPESTSAEASSAPVHPPAEQARIQQIVDGFSIQGIRKSGQNTRVFMNGRIQKLGDVVDIANQITLVGFTESELVFSDKSGKRYAKLL